MTSRFERGIIRMPAFWAVGLFLILANTPYGQAATIRVPADQPTIQTAVNGTVPGDMIVVAPGNYLESLDFMGKAVTVQSEQGPEVTTITGGIGPVVQFHFGEGRASVLKGFTITGGSSFYVPYEGGGGIRIANASPTILGNTIQNNRAASGGGGIAVLAGSPLIQDNVIQSNGQGGGFSGGTGGGGILLQGAGSAEIVGNTIASNTWSAGGGMTLFSAGTPLIRNNIIKNNSVSGCSPACSGGGMWIVNFADARIVNNLITGNSAGVGSGIYSLVPSGGRGSRFVSNTIVFNTATSIDRPTEVLSDGSQSQVEFVNNIIGSKDGAFALFCPGTNSVAQPILRHNDVFATNSRTYGGICADRTGSNGNLSVDPAFISISNEDYRLTIGSPAIDRGDNNDVDLALSDLSRQVRVADGNGDIVATVDVGAYEAQNPLRALGDSFLIRLDPSTNEGSNTTLRLDDRHIVVSFDLKGIPAGSVRMATLQMTLFQPTSDWGPHGRDLHVYALSAPIAEGNGFVTGALSPTRGAGSGTTWYCPVDTNITNQLADCPIQWNGGNAMIGGPTASVHVRNGQTGLMEFNVTADVLQALANNRPTVQWMLRRENERKDGQAVFYSREGAMLQNNPALVPGLKLQF